MSDLGSYHGNIAFDDNSGRFGGYVDHVATTTEKTTPQIRIKNLKKYDQNSSKAPSGHINADIQMHLQL